MVMLELAGPESWTADYLQRLPSEFRYEVHEGNLVVMAAAMRPWHADVQYRVVRLLRKQHRKAYIEQGVTLVPGEVRTCDVAVFRDQPDDSAAYHPVSAFELLVGVVSPSSIRADRITKPRLYAAAGVPEYWRVERDVDSGDATVFQYRLAHTEDKQGFYQETRRVMLAALEADLV